MADAIPPASLKQIPKETNAQSPIEFILFIIVVPLFYSFQRQLLSAIPKSLLWFIWWIFSCIFLLSPKAIGSKILFAVSKKLLPREFRNQITTASASSTHLDDSSFGMYLPYFFFAGSTIFCGWRGIQAYLAERLHRTKVSRHDVSTLRRKVSKLHRHQQINDDIYFKMDDLLVQNEKGVSKEKLLRQISSDIGNEFGSDTKNKMQDVVISTILQGNGSGGSETGNATNGNLTGNLNRNENVNNTFSSAIIERRLQVELGLLDEVASIWFFDLLKGQNNVKDETYYTDFNIDQNMSLNNITKYCNNMILKHCCNDATGSLASFPKCTKAQILSIIPYKLKKEMKKEMIEIQDQTNRSDYSINAEMFAEIYRFIKNNLIVYLLNNSDALMAWKNGSLTLGDDNDDIITHPSKEKKLKETNYNKCTSAGSTFRIRCYNLSYYSPNRIVVIFSLAREKNYIFMGRWDKNNERAKYTWVGSPIKNIQVTFHSICHIIDIFWPYLCYVEKTNLSSSCKRVLAKKIFITPQWVSSWNRRLSQRLRKHLKRRMKTNAMNTVSTNTITSFASGVGKDLDGIQIILPNLIMLQIWSFCGWNDKHPLIYIRGKPLKYPPPPKKENIMKILRKE